MHIPHSFILDQEVPMTKYRFSRGEGGIITVRAERVLGKQLVASITKTILPGEDVSAAMKELHKEVQAVGLGPPLAEGTASQLRLVE